MSMFLLMVLCCLPETPHALSFFTHQATQHSTILGTLSPSTSTWSGPDGIQHNASYELTIPYTVTRPTGTVEVVLSMDLFPELIQLCIWKDHSAGRIADLEASRIEICKRCRDFFDECFQQVYFRYTKYPPHLADGYNFRMTARIDKLLAGDWSIRIDNIKNLPHHSHVNFRLDVAVLPYTYLPTLLMLAAILGAVGVAAFVGLAALRTFCSTPSIPTELQTEFDLPQRAGLREMFLPRHHNGFLAWMTNTRSSETEPQPDAVEAPAGTHMSWLARFRLRQTSAELESENEDDICRICRSSEPASDLFSPCKCSGSMKYVHRACLQEWRSKTTNPLNRRFCSECRHPFLIVARDGSFEFALHMLTVGCIVAIRLAVLEAALLAVGYLFKCLAALFEPLPIDWSPDLYHHFLAVHVLAAFQFHWRVLEPFLQGRFSLCVVTLSLSLEVYVGYVVHLGLWSFNSVLWDWQLGFPSGCYAVAVYALYFHQYLVTAYQRWAAYHHNDEVIEPPTET
eukprot:NODE_1258_length_1579_cov_53.567493_g1188_i0.p1 GENE.NODE_1258_length_1579_cov_53.567493_g1188_i0~~NODE_1258_length_1579_cov_53.567493_g1188_i0.p1  ORF type:complete len:512 (+),score=102.00 NODE_1258_length_1579_cov_53.567493_g1188_i0:8-1543(+)